MNVRVQCDGPGCEKWADLVWEDLMYYNVTSPDEPYFEDSEKFGGLYFDQSFRLPEGWGAEAFQGEKVLCPEHRAGVVAR